MSQVAKYSDYGEKKNKSIKNENGRHRLVKIRYREHEEWNLSFWFLLPNERGSVWLGKLLGQSHVWLANASATFPGMVRTSSYCSGPPEGVCSISAVPCGGGASEEEEEEEEFNCDNNNNNNNNC
jgi:hypothetical protein